MTNKDGLKDCHIHVNCASWLPDHIEKNNVRSVFKYYIDDKTCTGALIRQAVDDPNNLEPIFLTARHCIHVGSSGGGSLVDLDNSQFQFNFNLPPNCNGSAPSYTMYPMNGGGYSSTRLYMLNSQGSILIDESPYLGSDLALLKMNEKPQPHFKAYYSGWSASVLQNVSNSHFYGIHHPKGDLKRTSRVFGPSVVSLIGRYSVFWQNGVTQKGSSGSPLFNSNGRIIGGLSGGTSGCVIPGPDFYGKFRYFWLFQSDVRNALNPLGQFTISEPGDEIYCYSNSYLSLFGQYYPSKIYQSNNEIDIRSSNVIVGGMGEDFDSELRIYDEANFTFYAKNEIILKPGFKAERGAEFKAIIQDCTSETVRRSVNQKSAKISFRTEKEYNDYLKSESDKLKTDRKLKINDR